ncbi:hypothetical protein GGI42DRAFT_349193 [Trichoderma sp. SZMC 28013]
MSDKEPVNVMSAVTTIINPLDPSSVLLFRCNDKSQLVIEERPVDGGDYVSITDNGCVEGNLKSEVGTTDLAAVSRGSMVIAYGITSYVKDDKTEAYVVAQVSPFYNPIAPVPQKQAEPKHAALAACNSVDGKSAYVSYFQENKETPGQLQITEGIFKKSNNNVGTFADFILCQPIESSRLASCYDRFSENRAIFFQGLETTNTYLRWVWSQNDQSTKINDTNKAAVGTPLACTIVDHPDKTFDLYLYFVDGTKALTRMVYSGNSDNGTWGSALTIGKAKVDASSGLTVVADRKENLNRVYFITKGDLKYTVLSDPFKGSEKGVSE